MKKLLFILILFVSVANNVQAQTKEETITWLQEKLQRYSTYNSTYSPFSIEDLKVEVTGCSVKLNYTQKQPYDSRHLDNFYNQYEIIPLESLRFYEQYGDIKTSTKNSIACIQVLSSNKTGLTSYTGLEIRRGEENLAERLQKAVDHLAAFCPKTKESF